MTICHQTEEPRSTHPLKPEPRRTKNLNRAIKIKEIEAVIEELLQEQKSRPRQFHKLVLKDIQEKNLVPTFHKLCHNIEDSEILPNTFCEAGITLILKRHRLNWKAKVHADIPDEYRCSDTPQNSGHPDKIAY